MLHRTALAAAATMVAVLLAGPLRAAHAALPRQDDRGRDRGRDRGGVTGRQTIDTTFRMNKGGLVDLEVTSGTIIVTGTTGNEVRVRANAGGGRVRLRASSTLATLRASGDARYEVSVPAGVRVVMHTNSGDLTATGVQGDVEAENVSGGIRLSDISGLAKVETVSGSIVATRRMGGARIETTSSDVTLTSGEGEITVDNTSGTIVLTDIRSSVVRAESLSGGVRFQGDVVATGRYEFSSHSGNIRLTLPPSAGALLTLSTYSGSINTDFPITLQQTSSGSDQKELQFRLGTGSARIVAESFSGNIIITRGTARDRQE